MKNILSIMKTKNQLNSHQQERFDIAKILMLSSLTIGFGTIGLLVVGFVVCSL